MSRALENMQSLIHDSLHQYCNNSDCCSKGFFLIPKVVVEEQVNCPKEYDVPPKRFDKILPITSNRQKRIKKSTLKLEEVDAITSPYGWNSKNVNQDQPWEIGHCLEQKNESRTLGNDFKEKNIDVAPTLTWPLNDVINPTYFSKAVGKKPTRQNTSNHDIGTRPKTYFSTKNHHTDYDFWQSESPPEKNKVLKGHRNRPNPEINCSSPITVLENNWKIASTSSVSNKNCGSITPTPKWHQSHFNNDDEMDLVHVCDPIRKSKYISEQKNKKLLNEVPISVSNNQWGAHNVEQNCSWIVNEQLGHGKKDGTTLKISKWN